MGKFSPTKLNGDCEEIADPSTAYGRRQRNWIDAHGAVPAGQVVDASCGNIRCGQDFETSISELSHGPVAIVLFKVAVQSADAVSSTS